MEYKCNQYKRPLVHKRIEPVSFVDIVANENCFQGYEVRKLSDITFPFMLEKESLTGQEVDDCIFAEKTA